MGRGEKRKREGMNHDEVNDREATARKGRREKRKEPVTGDDGSIPDILVSPEPVVFTGIPELAMPGRIGEEIVGPAENSKDEAKPIFQPGEKGQIADSLVEKLLKYKPESVEDVLSEVFKKWQSETEQEKEAIMALNIAKLSDLSEMLKNQKSAIQESDSPVFGDVQADEIYSIISDDHSFLPKQAFRMKKEFVKNLGLRIAQIEHRLSELIYFREVERLNKTWSRWKAESDQDKKRIDNMSITELEGEISRLEQIISENESDDRPVYENEADLSQYQELKDRFPELAQDMAHYFCERWIVLLNHAKLKKAERERKGKDSPETKEEHDGMSFEEARQALRDIYADWAEENQETKKWFATLDLPAAETRLYEIENFIKEHKQAKDNAEFYNTRADELYRNLKTRHKGLAAEMRGEWLRKLEALQENLKTLWKQKDARRESRPIDETTDLAIVRRRMESIYRRWDIENAELVRFFENLDLGRLGNAIEVIRSSIESYHLPDKKTEFRNQNDSLLYERLARFHPDLAIDMRWRNEEMLIDLLHEAEKILKEKERRLHAEFSEAMSGDRSAESLEIDVSDESAIPPADKGIETSGVEELGGDPDFADIKRDSPQAAYIFALAEKNKEELGLGERFLEKARENDQIFAEVLQKARRLIMVAVHGALEFDKEKNISIFHKRADLDGRCFIGLCELAGMKVRGDDGRLDIEYVRHGEYATGRLTGDSGGLDGFVHISEDDGAVTGVVDHHHPTSLPDTSSTEYLYKALKDIGCFEGDEFRSLDRLVRFVSEEDNKNFPLSREFFVNKYWRSPRGLARYLSFADLKRWFDDQKEADDMVGELSEEAFSTFMSNRAKRLHAARVSADRRSMITFAESDYEGIEDDERKTLEEYVRYGFIRESFRNGKRVVVNAVSEAQKNVFRSMQRTERLENDGCVVETTISGKTLINIAREKKIGHRTEPDDRNLPMVDAARASGYDSLLSWRAGTNGFSLSSFGRELPEGELGLEGVIAVRKKMLLRPESNRPIGATLSKILALLGKGEKKRFYPVKDRQKSFFRFLVEEDKAEVEKMITNELAPRAIANDPDLTAQQIANILDAQLQKEDFLPREVIHEALSGFIDKRLCQEIDRRCDALLDSLGKKHGEEAARKIVYQAKQELKRKVLAWLKDAGLPKG